jgi:hypothetical protein
MKYSKYLLAPLVAVVLLSLSTSTALGQDDTWRVVVLDVPGGGTQPFKEELSKGIPVEIKPQSWFIDQVRSRGFKVQKIMQRPGDLKWVLNGANIKYVVYLAPLGDNQFEARVVERATATPEFKIKVPRSNEGLNAEIAKQLAAEIKTKWGFDADSASPKAEDKSTPPKTPESEDTEQAPEPEPTPETEQKESDTGDGDEEPSLKAEVTDEQEEQKETQMPARATGEAFYEFSLIADFPKRDLLVGDFPQGGYLFEASTYPSGRLSITAFPFDSDSSAASPLGFYLDAQYGTKSYSFQDETGTQQDLSYGHLEGEFGLAARFGQVRFLLGARHRSLSSDNEEFLPTMSHTAVVGGAQFNSPLTQRIDIKGGAKFAPVVVHSSGVEAFGNSVSTVGFYGNAGFDVDITSSIAATGGYRFSVLRMGYEGQGDREFSDSEGTDLFHGPFIGVTYRLSP